MSKRSIYLFLITSTFSCFSCRREEPQFSRLDRSVTQINFENNLADGQALNIGGYIYYYNGGGVAVGDINNDSLPDIYLTANSEGNNKLYLNKGNLRFEDITIKAGVGGKAEWCTGVTMADVNGDNFQDIYVCAVANHHGVKGRNELFLNNGDNSFTESATRYGLDFSGFSTQSVFFDYDNDGDLDCFLLNQSLRPNFMVEDTSVRRKFDPYAGDRLYRNDLDSPSKSFTDVSTMAGIYQSGLGYGLGISVSDLNNDGWDDIYVGNDFHENDYYYINNGNGTFSESGAKYFSHYSYFSMGTDIADYNNDGQLDVISLDMLPDDEKILKSYGSDLNANIYTHKIIRNGFQYQYSKNCLQRNNGNGSSFSETSLLSGVAATDWSWSPLFADWDNDGKKDLFVSSGIVKRPVDLDFLNYQSNKVISRDALKGEFDQQDLSKMPDGGSHPFFFKGDGDISFSNMSEKWGTKDMKGYYTGAAYGDLDRDGDLDIVINAVNGPSEILRNNSVKRNFLSIRFKGQKSNTCGIGCKAYVFKNGKIQYQELMLTRGFQSSSDASLHFGLDTINSIDSIVVVWPGQKFEVERDITVNKEIIFSEKNATDSFVYARYFNQSPSLFENISNTLSIPWRHRENPFSDFNFYSLIPHGESTRGPKIAVTDVNKDGLDDFYACGAKGQAGALMLQHKDGKFIAGDTAAFAADADCEDVDALFLDANGDGNEDLYVVSGGNQYNENANSLLDRLYINDGKGGFSRSADALPPVVANKSCATASDIDHDGDLDIFSGAIASSGVYGIPQTSYLLINDGKGHFTTATEKIIQLKDLGIVTSAVFVDLNNDHWQDLVTAGEWTSIIIYMNEGGRFVKKEVPNSSGLWQTLMADDINNDGFPDLLAGNWGWNNKFCSDKDPPVRLYVADFDNNGQIEHLLSYVSHGIEYPFLGKDQVERQLPLLKKHYFRYADYGGVSMQKVFYGWIEKAKPLTAERLGSAVLYGNGKGDFKLDDLPAALQLAPIFSFQAVKSKLGSQKLYLAGGNFFNVIPYEGRYDAQPLVLFNHYHDSLENIPQENLAAVKGEVRDMKWLKSASNGEVLAVARNNDSLLFLKLNRSDRIK